MSALDRFRGPTWLVARRELVERAREKAFVIGTLVTMGVIIAFAVVPTFFDDDEMRTYDVGVVAADAPLASSLGALDLPGVRITTSVVDEPQADAQVRDGTLDAAVVGTGRVLVKEDLPQSLATALQLAAAGPAQPAFEVDVLEPVDQARKDRIGLVVVGTFLIYMQLVGIGLGVASGIVEEKTSRVVEVLLSRLRPSQLLAGKIIGMGVLTTCQLLSFFAVGLTAASVSGAVELPAGWPGAAGIVLAWFVFGYAFYACSYAIAGALASRPDEVQNTSGPLTMLLVIGFVVALPVSDDPESMVAVVTSFLPPTAPLVLPIRFAAGTLPVWQLLASTAISVAAIVAMVRVAGRIYATGALRTQRAMKLREAWSSADD